MPARDFPQAEPFTGTRTVGGAVVEVASRKGRPLCVAGNGYLYGDAWARLSQTDVALQAVEGGRSSP